jgi:hypothetical protein
LTRGESVAAGCAVTYVALCLAPVVMVWNEPLQPRVPVAAHVVRIFARPSLARSSYLPDVVVVATDAGLQGRRLVDYTKDGCQVGDVVQASQQGINVNFDPKTCRRPKEAEADD